MHPMPRCKIDAYTAISRNLSELAKIAKQLEIANKLKALELKGINYAAVTPEMVDDALAGN